MEKLYRKFAAGVSRMVGSMWTFLTVITLILTTGYYFHFSNSWQTHVNFGITLSTLLVLFFLQKSQNHSDKATHLKLDELIKAVEGARNEVASIENHGEKHMESLRNDEETKRDGEKGREGEGEVINKTTLMNIQNN